MFLLCFEWLIICIFLIPLLRMLEWNFFLPFSEMRTDMKSELKKKKKFKNQFIVLSFSMLSKCNLRIEKTKVKSNLCFFPFILARCAVSVLCGWHLKWHLTPDKTYNMRSDMTSNVTSVIGYDVKSDMKCDMTKQKSNG